MDELAVLLEVIVYNGGTVVSEEEAQAHLAEARVALLLAGKTVHVVSQGISDITDISRSDDSLIGCCHFFFFNTLLVYLSFLFLPI